MSQGSGARALPEGQSITKNIAESDAIQKELESKTKLVEELEEALRKLQSDSKEKEKENESLRLENNKLKAAIPQGAPVSSLETIDTLELLFKELRDKRLKISAILKHCKLQQERIRNLSKQLAAAKAKGIDYSKTESSISSHMGAPLTGPTTSNYNLTLSLASSESRNKYYEMAASAPLDSSKISHRPYRSDVDLSRYYTSSSSGTGFSDQPQELRHRRDPVESSDHIYGNNLRAHQLDSQATSAFDPSNTQTTMKKSMKIPKPAPRPRTSLRSYATNTTLASETVSGNVDSYEIIDKPTVAIPPHLGAINEYNGPSDLGFNSNSRTSSPILPNQPKKLTPNTVQAAVYPDRPLVIQTGVYPVQQTVPYPEMPLGATNTIYSERLTTADARNITQVCDVCKKDFPDWPQRRFMDHCIECAEKAVVEDVSFPTTVTEHSKQCPVCTLHFGQEVTQIQFENHVQGHFMEEDARHLGYDTLTK